MLRRILLIDDDPVDRDILRYRLEHDWVDQVECRGVDSGLAGLATLHDWRPDCALLDLDLPDVKGLEVLRSARRVAPSCPVIVITAHGSEEIAAEAMRKGAADYLVKGNLAGSTLTHCIDRVLEREALQREVESQRIAIEDRNRELEAGIAREMLARRTAEENERRYRTLAEAIPQIVWTACHPSGEIDYVNERWTRVTGLPESEALGHRWIEMLHAEDRMRTAEKWAISRTARVQFEFECRLRSADGNFRWNLIRAVPVMGESETLTWLGTFTDLEEQKRAEQLIAHRQRLESIGLLAGGLAHDFNNLLVGIIGAASYTLELLPRDHEGRQMLDLVLNSGDRAAHLIRQMLAYAGKGQFVVEQLNLSEVVQKAWELVKAAMPGAIDVQFLTREGLPPLMADCSQIEQIVMNLLLNAAEAIPSGKSGRIIVRTDLERISRPLANVAGDLEAGDYLVLEVRDDGCGMDEGTVAKIFDPFFTTKFTGRGLGLAAVQGIVRHNGGAIMVESAPQKGTTFKILLPPGVPDSSFANVVPIDDLKPLQNSRVLVVDDEELVRKVAVGSLERAGYHVQTASSGIEAIELVRRSDPFSLILLDMGMPEMSGIDTLIEIRSLGSDVPIVLCSGYSEPEMRKRSQGLVVSGYLQKPFTSKDLRECVSECLRNERRSARTAG